MCGVIGLTYENNKGDLGQVAAELLKTLEYRGYDSTGGAFQGDDGDVRLLKGVGAPSVMVHELGITRMGGRVFCGQVRWATFGAVTNENSQPHVVRCKTFLYGAHNGNVTNCDDLKTWLESEGHVVLSDNDGEMVVHTVEHLFSLELARSSDKDRRRCMRAALVAAATKLEGSFAAVIVDPVTRVMWAVKQGSSLYFGIGTDRTGGRFAIASSDLSSVLKLTRVVVPVTEGEFVEYEPGAHRIYSIVGGRPVDREPVRSRLRAKDTALVPPFETFMDQEISAQEQTIRDVVTLFLGGSDAARAVRGDLFDSSSHLDALLDQYEDERIRSLFHWLVDLPAFRALLAEAPPVVRRARHLARRRPASSRTCSPWPAMPRTWRRFFCSTPCSRPRRSASMPRRSRASVTCATTRSPVAVASMPSAAGARTTPPRPRASSGASSPAWSSPPILPGEFRGQSARSLRDGDLVIAVSQSGETKDVIDVLNDVLASGRDVGRIALVNNVSSTLAQEKCELVIPLRCGPEIAVPATKSFMNQMVVFYCLALHLATRQGQGALAPAELEARRDKLRSLPALVRETVDSTDADVEVAAKLLYLRPSIHILATRIAAVAKEGALKIREVVLNHTEGFEASEFKHGPNTILGFNTVLGPEEVDAMLKHLGHTLRELAMRASAAGLGAESLERLLQATTDGVLSPSSTPFSLTGVERELFERIVHRAEILHELYADYPLIYVTGPDERDVALTVSQINTHKIRGSRTVVIAEDHPALRGAATKAPADNPSYGSVYITLPRTGDTLMATFSATVALQRLALKMSLLKKHYLDRLGVADHGVDPDVPKNVSKSITVD